MDKTQGLIAYCQVFAALAVIYLVVGLIKPRWVWLGGKEPNRHVIIAISLVALMATITAGTELSLKHKKEVAEAQKLEAMAIDTQKAPPPPAQAAAPAPAPAPAEAVPAPKVAEATAAVAATPAPVAEAKPGKDRKKSEAKKKATAKAE